ncbi:MAG: hypothetical protein CVU46_11085 [Chloroflexi bacterium HGW-Chloroflexi-8]|nr:MAG: hypothetical protein CVU46_11085 [Chloroflexi bacterium HGW-Chloroflexi-8]
MIKLSDLQKKIKKLDIQFQGEVLSISYHINVITPEFLDESLDIPKQLEKAIAAWDLVDDDGNSLEVTEATLRQLPTQFLVEISSAITKDMQVGDDEKKD